MRKCKWAGDVADEYCKNCDGIKMMVDGLEKSCDECAGYEPGTEEVDSPVEEVVEETEEIMTPPVEESKPNKETTKSNPKTNKPEKYESTKIWWHECRLSTENEGGGEPHHLGWRTEDCSALGYERHHQLAGGDL